MNDFDSSMQNPSIRLKLKIMIPCVQLDHEGMAKKTFNSEKQVVSKFTKSHATLHSYSSSADLPHFDPPSISPASVQYYCVGGERRAWYLLSAYGPDFSGNSNLICKLADTTIAVGVVKMAACFLKPHPSRSGCLSGSPAPLYIVLCY